MMSLAEAIRTLHGYKAIVLISGGIDSSTAFAMAVEEHGKRSVGGLSIDYAQRHSKEIQFAQSVCEYYGCPHAVLSMPSYPSKLTDPSSDIPKAAYSELQGVSPTYVPFRNGLMIANMAAFADACGASEIYHGAHLGDAAGNAYPDCTMEFLGAMAAAVKIGTYDKVRLRAPLIEMTKKGIISQGAVLKVPYHLTWSCYVGGSQHCGECPTCIARHQGFVDAGVPDPTIYSVSPKPEHA